jgi:hypothetical protein
MPVSRIPLCALSMLLGLLSAASVAAVPTVQYSQNGTTFHPLVLLSGTASAASYYGFSANNGHPGFGVAKGTDTASLYWDTTDNTLSLIFISGKGLGDKGSGNLSITGLPAAAMLTLNDHGLFSVNSNTSTLTGRFNYKNTTDGFTLGGLETTSFTAKITLSKTKGIKALRLTVGDPMSGGAFQPLNLSQPLYLTSTAVVAAPGGTVGSPVPEPTCLGMLGLIAAGLLKRSRRILP